jgi:CBS domain-containing protein
MKTKELMKENVFTVNLNTPLKDVTEKLLTENYSCVIVTNYSNDIVGIITLSDLFRFLFPDYNEIREHREYLSESVSILKRLNKLKNLPAETCMTKFPEVINEKSSAIEAAAIMKDFKIKQLPVIENGKLIGIITSKDILKSFILQMTDN